MAKSTPRASVTPRNLKKARVVTTNGDDLSDPTHVLNRTNGKTKEQIDAERVALVERDKARSTTQHRILSGGEPAKASLTEHDRQAIAELKSGEAQKKEIATANRIGKLKAKKSGATSAMPLTGKAALSAIAQSATKEFVDNGGTIKKVDDKQQEPKMPKTAKKVAKAAPKAKRNGKHKVGAKTAAQIEKVIVAMLEAGKKGVTNPEQKKITGGRRIHAGPLKEAVEARGLKFSFGERDGLKTYVAAKK